MRGHETCPHFHLGCSLSRHAPFTFSFLIPAALTYYTRCTRPSTHARSTTPGKRGCATVSVHRSTAALEPRTSRLTAEVLEPAVALTPENFALKMEATRCPERW